MKHLTTHIKKEVWTENGENKVRYRAVVSGINWQGIFWRANIGTVLLDLRQDLRWLADEEIDKLLGDHPKGSLERAQALIDMYRAEVDRRNSVSKKLIFFTKYPEDQ